jgi:HAD superfamily hydrolase (TIGR01509 family)
MNKYLRKYKLKKGPLIEQNKKYQDCIIFDCDGVLVDSECIMQKLCITKLRSFGFFINELEYTHLFTGANLEYIQRVVHEKEKIIIPDDFFDMDHDAAFSNQLEPLTKNVLDYIHQMNINRCIASNNIKSKIEYLLGQSRIDHFFNKQHIFTAQQAGKPKPAPDLFLLAAEHMKKKPDQCIVIEDSALGIEAALSAGMRVIGFLVASHTQHEAYKSKIANYSVPIVYSEQELICCLQRMLGITLT